MTRSLLLLAALAVVGCDEQAAKAPAPAPVAVNPGKPPAETPPARPDEPSPPVQRPEAPETPVVTPPRPGPSVVGVDDAPGEAVDLAPPAVEVPPPARARRRMNLDQLDAAFRRVSGGIGWTEQRGANEVNLFEELSATLGKPDYMQITTESLEPSALFQKFLDDAARSVCTAIIARDQAVNEQPIVLPEEDVDIDEHLAALVLRWHGRSLTEGSPDLMHWRWLHDSVAFVSSDAAEVWGAVCVGLYTHPDFYTY